MSRKSGPTFRFDFQDSLISKRLIGLLHGFALLACLANSLGPCTKVVLVAGTLSSLWLNFKYRPRFSAIRGIRVGADGQWTLFDTEEGPAYAVDILRHTIASPLLVVLRWRRGGRQGSFVVFPDSLPGDQFRELRVALRIANID